MNKHLLEHGFRWYGPKDRVPLSYIKQAGVESLFTSLHHIPYGELWTCDEINSFKKIVEDANLRWSVVESLPISEDIKTRTGDYKRHMENYKQSIVNLAKCGVKKIIYNFMPVLDWIRTDLRFDARGDGSRCLKYDPSQFAAFEIYLLKRPNAEENYTSDQLERAKSFFESLTDGQKKKFERDIIDVFPGCKFGLSIDDVRAMLAKYSKIDAAQLKEHLVKFLNETAPVAEENGAILAIHPDDPPIPVLGLPRIASCTQDFLDIFAGEKSPANTVALCAGSLSANPKNVIHEMVDALADRIHVVHLRSTQRMPDGSFFEAGHLDGSVNMYEVLKRLLALQERRVKDGLDRIVFRPDHGRDMADDLEKPYPDNPGYSYIGRMMGLAELRGMQCGILGEKPEV